MGKRSRGDMSGEDDDDDEEEAVSTRSQRAQRRQHRQRPTSESDLTGDDDDDEDDDEDKEEEAHEDEDQQMIVRYYDKMIDWAVEDDGDRKCTVASELRMSHWNHCLLIDSMSLELTLVQGSSRESS